MWHGINNRRFPRVSYKCLITIGAKGAAKHFLTNTENIGVGGICVSLIEGLGVFSEVNIELAVKDGLPPVKCRGHIVWVVKSQSVRNSMRTTKFDTGIEFVDLKEEDLERIESVVERAIRR
jgi:hypothetical protein